jgi:hypothetical protein
MSEKSDPTAARTARQIVASFGGSPAGWSL